MWEITISYAVRVEMELPRLTPLADYHADQSFGKQFSKCLHIIERGLGSPVESPGVLKSDRPQFTSQSSLLLEL